MHLYYLMEKSHRMVKFNQSVRSCKLDIDGERWYGAMFDKSASSCLIIRSASEHRPFTTGADDVGWYLYTESETPVTVKTKFLSDNASVGNEQTVSRSSGLTPYFLPNVLDSADPFDSFDLHIECDQPSDDVFIATSRNVSRKSIYALVEGCGVEIGPGPRPQIHNDDKTQVIYVEERLGDDWLNTYHTAGKAETWSDNDYRLGKAHELPVDDSSQDFIFSSHVLEHLYNP